MTARGTRIPGIRIRGGRLRGTRLWGTRTEAARRAVVVAAAGVVAVALLGWGSRDQVADGDPHNRAAALVPPDGERRLTSDDGQVSVTEEARLTGPEMVLTSPPLVGGQLATMLAASSGRPESWRIWRSTQTAYDVEAAGSPEQSTTLRQLTDRGVLQLADYGAFTLVFDPPVLEVPADARAGRSWTGRGDALSDGSITYVSRLRTEAATHPGGRDCVRVRGDIAFSAQGTQFFDLPLDETWCRGEGIVEDGPASTQVKEPAFTGSTAPPPAGHDADVPTADQVSDWSAHDRPVVIAEAVESVAKTGGEATLVVDVPPVARPDGGLAVANGTGNDVLGLTAGSGPARDSLVRSWVGHPGGVISALGTSGDVTVVGTSDREAVAYGAHGQWLWTRPLPDVPVAAPVALDGRHLALTTVGGDLVVVDPTDGHVRWRAGLSDQVRVAPIGVGDAVAATDVAGLVGVWDVASGDRRWTTDLGSPSLALAVSGDRLAVLDSDGVVHAYALGDGRRLWTRAIPGSNVGAALAGVGDTVVASSADGTIGLDAASGRVRWESDGADASIAAGGVLLQTHDHVLAALDADGRRLGRWPLDLTGDSDFVVPGPDSVRVMDAGGKLVEVGP